MNFKKLETLRKLRKFTYEELAEMIGMSKNGLNIAINNEELKVSTLEKLANVLGVKPVFFFEDPPDVKEPLDKYITNVVPTCTNCAKLEKIIEKQENIINRLERDLEACRNQLNKPRTN
jgi:transcriptional regulator with XRE-family HTH domain